MIRLLILLAVASRARHAAPVYQPKHVKSRTAPAFLSSGAFWAATVVLAVGVLAFTGVLQ